jgi:hypothetical protein
VKNFVVSSLLGVAMAFWMVETSGAIRNGGHVESQLLAPNPPPHQTLYRSQGEVMRAFVHYKEEEKKIKRRRLHFSGDGRPTLDI